MISERNNIIASLYVVIGAILYSSKAILVKKAYLYEVDSNSLLALRMIFSLPLFLLVAYYVRKSNTQNDRLISKKDWAKILLLGICGFYIASLTDFLGLQYITAGLERLILFSFPTIVVLLNLITGKKIPKIVYLAIAITYLGIVVAYWGSLSNSGNLDIVKGSLLVALAAVSYAIYVFGSGNLIPRVGSLRYTAWAMSAACLAIILHNGIIYRWNLFLFPAEVYYYALAMAIFSTVIPTFLLSEGIKRIGSSKASVISSIGPVSTITLAYIFLGERYGITELFGMLIIITGVLIIALQKTKPKQ